jgi:putative membrane protein
MSIESRIPVLNTAKPDDDSRATELSARRTGMSFQRTRMSADRTLMSVIRTSLSLIGFGFTIYQVFQRLADAGILKNSVTPRRAGEMLVGLGILMLVVGIWYHVSFMLELRRHRELLRRDGLIHGETEFPTSMVLIVAVLLLAFGLMAIYSMIFNIALFD